MIALNVSIESLPSPSRLSSSQPNLFVLISGATSLTGVCQFGMSHVDSSKGDLDGSSGPLYSPEATVDTASEPGSRVAKKIVYGDAIYHKGTYEKWANPVDSQGHILANTAHEYMECSNKGICDRSRGVCECFSGYEGSACQRASCPIAEGNEGIYVYLFMYVCMYVYMYLCIFL